MKPPPHTYQARLIGGPADYASLSAPGAPDLRSAPPVELDLRGELTVDREAGVTRFTEIVLRPRLTLGRGADRARALWVLEKTRKACLVTAALSTPVRMDPDIHGT